MLPAEAVDKSKLSGAARVGFPVRIGGSVDHPEAGSLEMWTQHELEGLFCAGVQTIPQPDFLKCLNAGGHPAYPGPLGRAMIGLFLLAYMVRGDLTRRSVVAVPHRMPRAFRRRTKLETEPS